MTRIHQQDSRVISVTRTMKHYKIYWILTNMLSTFDCTDLLQWDQHSETSCYYLVITLEMADRIQPSETALEVTQTSRSVWVAAALLVPPGWDDPVTNTRFAAGGVSPQLRFTAELQPGRFREFKDLRPLRFCSGCLLRAAVKSAQQTLTISTTSFLRLAAPAHRAPRWGRGCHFTAFV